MSVQEDRRDANTQRIAFDGIVELGQEADSPGFEAQGVNLSTSGMQLRTAYLPDVGQPLVCRFSGMGQEIMADADVVWRREGSRGGEFGVRFSNVDGDGATALSRMCGANHGDDAAAGDKPAPGDVDPGTRVRLHIDGLGSPMKARVRGANEDALLVGSNLEFLRVGRPLELEDVDHGGKRPAHVDRVEVEVDRESKVPQLIVSLRYDEASRPASAEPAARGSARTEGASVSAAPTNVAPTVDADESDLAASRGAPGGFDRLGAAFGPSVARFGATARTAASLLWAKACGAPAPAPEARRRTTAPPPGGSLHASGKRVVRQASTPDAQVGPFSAGPSRRKALALAGGVASGVLVISLGVALAHSKSTAPAAAAVASASAAPPSAEPVASGDALQANVPLYGATTLAVGDPGAQAQLPAASRTPVAAGAAALAPGLVPPGSAPAALAAPAAAPAEAANAGDKAQASEDEDDRGESKTHKRVTPFVHGKVKHPITLRVRMDAAISEINGARTPTGFTVAVPGTKMEGNASTLASKDPRIAVLSSTNGPKGAELTVKFKDGVPAYAVRARGHHLIIALGRAEEVDAPASADHSRTSSDRLSHADREERHADRVSADREERHTDRVSADREERHADRVSADREERHADREDRASVEHAPRERGASHADGTDHETERTERARAAAHRDADRDADEPSKTGRDKPGVVAKKGGARERHRTE